MFTGQRRPRRAVRKVVGILAALVATGGMLALGAPPASAASTTYYVDCSASTNGNGTSSSPWNSTASVNAPTFSAGNTILFRRGTTCTGSLAPQGSGASGSPITIDAYGTGALPIIATGSSADAAVKLSDQSYWTIQNLKITGGVHFGVYITGTVANAVMTDVNLINLDVSAATGTSTNRGDSGEVYVYPTGSKEVINNVKISGVAAHDSKVAEGIFVGGAYGANPPGTSVLPPGQTPIGQNIVIENSSAYNVYGDGILMTMVKNGTIQNNVASNSGNCGGCGSTPSGIWEWYCQGCLLQNNESYDNHSWAPYDGGGFDIDNYNTDNIVQYNYAHGNNGYCIALYGDQGFTPTRDVFRYNVCSQNSQDPQGEDDEVSLVNTAPTTDIQIYNNTFYYNPKNSFVPKNGGSLMEVIEGSTQGLFKNNLVYSTAQRMLDVVPSGMQFDNNLYYVAGGAAPQFYYNGTTYSG